MAAITDLTFDQLEAQTPEGTDVFFVGEDTNGDIGVLISLTALTGDPVEDLTSEGVVKVVAKLLEVCRKAQAAVNTNQTFGEQLAAFPPASTSGEISDGALEIVEQIRSKIIVASATQIVGHTNGVVVSNPPTTV